MGGPQAHRALRREEDFDRWAFSLAFLLLSGFPSDPSRFSVVLLAVLVGVILTEVFKLFYENFFMVVFVVLYVVILRIVFINIDSHIRLLQEMYVYFTTINIQDVTPLHHKLRLLYTMKLSFCKTSLIL